MESADATIAVMDQILADHASAERPADEDRPRCGYAHDDGVELVRPAPAIVVERPIERLPRLAVSGKRLIVAWTDDRKPARARASAIPIAGL